jgi:hypothetical protein
MNINKFSRALGWFSMGLGTAELVAPGFLAKSLQMRPRPRLMRSFGMREMMSGIGLLRGRNTNGWLWSRVVGDAMDLTMLASAIKEKRRNRTALGIATAAVAGVTALDVYCSIASRSPRM